MNERQTVAGAYAKIESHEDLCAERYSSIHETLGEMKSDAKMLRNLGASVLLALVGWMAVQLFAPLIHTPQTQTQTQGVQVSAPK